MRCECLKTGWRPQVGQALTLYKLLYNYLYMRSETAAFVDMHATRDAFLGNRLARLVDQIADEGEALFRERGLSFRSTSASTVLLMSERKDLSIADIARELRQPHQLASQRVEALMGLGLAASRPDPSDRRRKVLRLTRKGAREAAILRTCLDDAAAAFRALFDEIGVDVPAVMDKVSDALRRASLSERIAKDSSS